MEMVGGLFALFGLMLSLIPLVIAILLVIWVYQIRQNSAEQVKQNNEIIRLLKNNASE